MQLVQKNLLSNELPFTPLKPRSKKVNLKKKVFLDFGSAYKKEGLLGDKIKNDST